MIGEWLQQYNEFLGIYHAAVITSIFGAFCVTFAVLVCWPRLVKDFGPAGGFVAAALLIGTCWLINHKLPGYGISEGLMLDMAGNGKQYGLIHQGLYGSAPWVDMGWAIAMGFVVFNVLSAKKADRKNMLKEAFPRWIVILAGGAIGGILAGLTGYTNANL